MLGRGPLLALLSRASPSRRWVPGFSSCQLHREIHSHEIQFPRQHPWNRAVSEAETLVGFPCLPLSLRALLLNDDVSSMEAHMRKLMGSDHPVLKTLKRLFYHEKNNLQIRGLLLLLCTRSLNKAHAQVPINFDSGDFGITPKQRKLAEYVEMIYTAQGMHRSVLNLPIGFHDEPDSELKEDLLQLEFGNKIAILGGDYLLANACTGLADLRNTYIVEMISMAIADFARSEFLDTRDVQGRFIPTTQNTNLQSWLERNNLAHGNLLANGCKGAALLADMSKEIQDLSSVVGANISLALQAFSELQPFADESYKTSFDLSSAPVLLHLEEDRELLDYIQRECKRAGESSSDKSNVDRLNFKKIHQSIMSSGVGIRRTQELSLHHAKMALGAVEAFPDGDAKVAIKAILAQLMQQS